MTNYVLLTFISIFMGQSEVTARHVDTMEDCYEAVYDLVVESNKKGSTVTFIACEQL